MGVFDGAKYQTAANRALQFIKDQLDINHFDFSIHWGAEYSDWYEGDVMWGSVTGFTGGEGEVEPRYISTSRFYGYDYTGQVSGSWRNVGSPSNAGVNVYVFRDVDYEVVTCPLGSGGSWIAEWEYKEVYKVIDPETGEESEETVYYTLPVEVREGVKEFRLGYGLSSHWELISSTEDMKAYRKVYSLSREETPENGGYAYGYLTDYSVRVFAYADTEYMLEDCKIWNCGEGGYIWFTNHVTQGHKIAKVIHPIPGGYEVIGLAGAVANIESGRLPASFFIPEDDPQYDKDGTRAQRVYGYCLNSRTWAYDVGLALLVFTTSGDYEICKEMLDRMAFEQNYDGSFNFSYDIYIGQLFEDYVRTGAMGWLLWGACYYALTTGDTAYNEMIKKAGDFLISRQITDTKDPRYGLLKGGYGTYDFDDYSYIEGEIEWCSTEHQCSALQGLEGCSLVLNVKKYKEAAELIRDQLYFKLYDKEHGRFFQGISAAPDNAWALDCTTWAGMTAFSILNKECSFACEDAAKDEFLTSGRYIVRSSAQDYYNQRYSSSHAFSGFKPYSDRDGGYTGSPDIVWTEGTLGYAALALLLGHGEEAKTYVDECIALQEIENGTGGVLYVTATHAQLPWEFHVWESVVSSAWLYLLIKNPDVLFPKTLRQVYYMARITNIQKDGGEENDE